MEQRKNPVEWSAKEILLLEHLIAKCDHTVTIGRHCGMSRTGDSEGKFLHSFIWEFVKTRSQGKAYGFESTWQPKCVENCCFRVTEVTLLSGRHSLLNPCTKKLTKEPRNSLSSHIKQLYGHGTTIPLLWALMLTIWWARKGKNKYLIEFMSYV